MHFRVDKGATHLSHVAGGRKAESSFFVLDAISLARPRLKARGGLDAEQSALRRGEHAAFVSKADAGGFEGPAERGNLVGLDVALVVLEAQDGAATHAGGGARLLKRPYQRRPRHPRLLGREDGTFQNYLKSHMG